MRENLIFIRKILGAFVKPNITASDLDWGDKGAYQRDDVQRILRDIEVRRRDLLEREQKFEEERKSMVLQLEAREAELSEQAQRSRDTVLKREYELRHQLERQRALFDEELLNAKKKHAEIEAALDAKMVALEAERNQLAAEFIKFEDEKLRYTRESKEQLQAVSSKYVGDVISALRTREKSLSRKSTSWANIGGCALFLVLLLTGHGVYVANTMPTTVVTWSALSLNAFKGIAFLGVSGVISRYAFLLSKKYLAESLRVSQTIHDISFGQLYVQSYGASAGWEQVKEAFSRWHNSDENSKSRDLNDVDQNPKVFESIDLEKIVEAIKSLRPAA